MGGYFVCSLRERNPHRPPGGAPFKRGLFRLRTGVTPSFDRASDHPSDLPDSPVIPCIISRFASELTIWVHGCPVHSSDRLFLSDHNKLRPLSVYSRPLSDSPANAVIKFLASLHQHRKCQGLNAEKSKIVFCALFTKAVLPLQSLPPGQAPAVPAQHTFPQGCRAGTRLPTSVLPVCPPRLSR